MSYGDKGVKGGEWEAAAYVGESQKKLKDIEVRDYAFEWKEGEIEECYMFSYPLRGSEATGKGAVMSSGSLAYYIGGIQTAVPAGIIAELVRHLARHDYIVVKLKGGNKFYRFEKVMYGICIVWGTDFDEIKNHGHPASDITRREKFQVNNKTVKQIIQWLVNTNQFDKAYDVKVRNCQHFAAELKKFLS